MGVDNSMIKLICQKASGEKIDITNLLINITWSGDYKSCARKLEFSLVSSSYDINIPKVDIPLMSVISFYEDDNELFKGFVYEREKSSDNSMSFLCYDYCAKLNDIKVSKNIKNQTASTIYNNFLTEYGLNKGDIVSASTNINKVFLGVTAYDMIMTAYTEEAKNTGKKYMLYSRGNKFYASEKGIVKLKLSFEEGKNILSSSFKESVSNMVNKVLIVDENGNKVSEVKNEEWHKTYGLFQDVWAPLTEAGLNLVLSILLGYFYGLIGILFGVLISMLLIVCGWKPFFLYKCGFHEGVGEYVVGYLKYVILIIISFVCISALTDHLFVLPIYSYATWGWLVFRVLSFYTLSSFLLFAIVDKSFRRWIIRIMMLFGYNK